MVSFPPPGARPRWGLGWAGGLLLLAGCSTPAIVAMVPSSLSPAALGLLALPPFLQDPATAEQYRLDGLAFRQQGSLDRAIATLTIAAALDPLNPDSHVILGWTQHLAGQPAAASASLTTALNRRPQYEPALNALGIVYLVNGQLAEAVEVHQQAVNLNPDNEIAHYNLSLAYQRLNQLPAAIYHGTVATTLEPGNPHPWVALALAHWSNGNQAEATQHYRQALRLDGRYTSRPYLDHLIQAGFSAPQVETTNVIRQATL